MEEYATQLDQHRDSLKKRSDVMDLLVLYTNFLLGSQYVDTDVYAEEPTPIDVFMAIWDDDNPQP